MVSYYETSTVNFYDLVYILVSDSLLGVTP